ncbi:SEC-C domain-containing protein [Polyangium jinanense]|uniref:SEC-C domain-containing protein n=1 Tax=Polyangium jinanense TaxID=2829994 RepID=A0A9X4AYU3_9BACT|nr:SEC-C domain-containing protein [Polyangium jinanense]MDC3989136.1 SEC-C domain-containing protein [Polyangium jinanense]
MDPLYLGIVVVVAIATYFLLASKRKASSDEKPVPVAPRRSGAKALAPPKAESGTASSFAYSGKTVLFYDPSHGNQAEYYDPNGRCYLWYPGNRGVVPGEWRVEGQHIAFRYGTNTYNPVTGEHGGSWEPTLLQRWGTNIVDAAPGDVFGLATGRIPYRLPPDAEFRSIDEAKLGGPSAMRDEAPCPCGSAKLFSQCHGAEEPAEEQAP